MRKGHVQAMALLAFMLAALPGCGEETLFGKANPRTTFEYNARGAKFFDNKNNSIELEGSYNPETKAVNITKFTVKNDASGVRESDVLQINALVNQQLAFNAGIEAFGKAFQMGAATVMPWLGLSATETGGSNITTPWGSFGSTTTRVPTTQPAPPDTTFQQEVLTRLSALEARLSNVPPVVNPVP